MTVVQGLLDVTNPTMEDAMKKLEACRKKEVVDTKRYMFMVYIPNMLLLGISGSVNYMWMITVSLSTACLLHTQTSE